MHEWRGGCRRVCAIALNTFREVGRDRVLYLFFVFAVVMIAGSKVIGWISIGEDIKVVRDLGLAAQGFFGVLVAVFVGGNLIHKELEHRTIYSVLSRPVGRGEFLVGRYLGLLAAILLVVAAMAVFFTVYQALLVWAGAGGWYAAEGGAVPLGLVRAQFLIAYEFVLLTALAAFFSAVTTPLLSAVFTFLLYVLGHAAEWIYIFSEMVVEKEKVGGLDVLFSALLRGFYYLVPNLDTFDMRIRAAHGLDITNGEFVFALIYGASYAAVALLAGYLALRRKPL